jgi:hypothetical protein
LRFLKISQFFEKAGGAPNLSSIPSWNAFCVQKLLSLRNPRMILLDTHSVLFFCGFLYRELLLIIGRVRIPFLALQKAF